MTDDELTLEQVRKNKGQTAVLATQAWFNLIPAARKEILGNVPLNSRLTPEFWETHTEEGVRDSLATKDSLLDVTNFIALASRDELVRLIIVISVQRGREWAERSGVDTSVHSNVQAGLEQVMKALSTVMPELSHFVSGAEHFEQKDFATHLEGLMGGEADDWLVHLLNSTDDVEIEED